MRFVYFTLAVLLYIVALPFLVYLRSKPKYHDSIPARFFLKDNPRFDVQGIWFHACSLGEVRSLSPFIEKLTHETVCISVITQTGFKEAKKHAFAHVRYLPFEIFLPFWMNKHKVLVVMEAELWPLLFIVAKAKGIKTVLLNARISDHSYRSYAKWGWFYRWIFKHIDLVLAQSDEDKTRLMQLGAKEIDVCGNIKQFQRYEVTKSYPKNRAKRLIILASTHEKEEALILDTIGLKPNDQVVVVPRHPERFEKVDAWLHDYARTQQRSYTRFSEHGSLESDVILCDTMGELINLYAIADIVILGGSFVEGVGGHNPLEPAFFGVKLISGESIFNQKVLFASVENSITCNSNTLGHIFETIEQYPASSISHGGDVTPLLEKILG